MVDKVREKMGGAGEVAKEKGGGAMDAVKQGLVSLFCAFSSSYPLLEKDALRIFKSSITR